MKHLVGTSSLGRRLSILLAIQVFIGLTLVSIVVYLIIANHLSSRHTKSLEEKQRLVNHLMSEARLEGDYSVLFHQLDDFLEGHQELALRVIDSNDTKIYDSTQGRYNERDFRFVKFPVLTLRDTNEKAFATLFYDDQADEDLLLRLASTLGIVSLLGALLVSGGAFLLVRRGLRPLNDLVVQTTQLSADSLHYRLDGSEQPDELQPLIIQFNGLLDRLSSSYAQLEGFNADVAHELNTPLTTLITSTELALRRPQDLDAFNDILGSNLEELHRMSEIIKDMLFLSRAQRGTQARRTAVGSLAVIAGEVADYHEASLADAELAVEIVGDATGEYDVPLIKRAISNLLGNAARYAHGKSIVQVEIDRPSTQCVNISVINQGQAIPEAQKSRLFDRFYRADTSRTMADLHHGLGLSIVAGIARMHGGEPFVESNDTSTRIGFSVFRLD